MAPKIKSEPVDDDKQSSFALAERKKSKSWSGWTVNLIARIALWYSLFQILFQCPSSLESIDATHPRVCKPYLTARKHLEPHVTPIYDTYAAPYVAKVKPYTDIVHEKAYTPALTFAKTNYERYGQPRVQQGQAILQAEWDKNVKPQIENARMQAQAQYDVHVAPHVNQAMDVIQPHYDTSKKFAEQQYTENVVPAYEKSLPYVQTALHHARKFTVEIGYPYARWTSDSIMQFVWRKAWPQIRILYGENVHPQLVRIRERLANYREGKRLEAILDETPTPETPGQTAAMVIESISSAAAKVADAVTSAVSVSEQSTGTISSSTQVETEAAAASAAVKKQVTEELKAWQGKFIKAADKGAEDLDARIESISSRQIEESVQGTGSALITRLEETVATALDGIRSRMQHDIEAMDESADSAASEVAIEKLRNDIRKAGQHVKVAAQDLRSWKAKLIEDTRQLIEEASHSTLEVLDSIRDLGLQEIGMRWASMEGVTYQDWTEYHTLKKTFDKWRHKVDQAGTKSDGLKKVTQAAEDVESEGMAIAEDAAKELIRLRDVAAWKVHARDATDDFSTRAIPVAAVKEKIVEQAEAVSEAVFGSSTPEPDSFDAATSKLAAAANDAISSASSFAQPAAGSASSFAAAASEALLEPVESVFSTVTATQTVMERLSAVSAGIVEEASPVASSLAAYASSASSIQSEIDSSATSIASKASSYASASMSAASEAIASGAQAASSAGSSASSFASSHASIASSAASASGSSISSVISSAASSVSGAASSVVVPSRSSSFQDTVSEKASSASSVASSAISSAGSAVSDGAESVVESGSKYVSSVLE